MASMNQPACPVCDRLLVRGRCTWVPIAEVMALPHDTRKLRETWPR